MSDCPQKHVLSDGKARALMAHQMQASCDQACQVHEHGATHSERKEEDTESAKASRRQLKENLLGAVRYECSLCLCHQSGRSRQSDRSKELQNQRRAKKSLTLNCFCRRIPM